MNDEFLLIEAAYIIIFILIIIQAEGGKGCGYFGLW
jgi:hypothetical protein